MSDKLHPCFGVKMSRCTRGWSRTAYFHVVQAALTYSPSSASAHASGCVLTPSYLSMGGLVLHVSLVQLHLNDKPLDVTVQV